MDRNRIMRLGAILFFCIFLASTAYAQSSRYTREAMFSINYVSPLMKDSIERSIVYYLGVQTATLNLQSKTLYIVYNSNTVPFTYLRGILTRTGLVKSLVYDRQLRRSNDDDDD